MRAPLTSTSTQFLANHDRPAVTGARGLFPLTFLGILSRTARLAPPQTGAILPHLRHGP
jgi:hypothetical protein